MALMSSADWMILIVGILLPTVFGFSLLFGLEFGKDPAKK